MSYTMKLDYQYPHHSTIYLLWYKYRLFDYFKGMKINSLKITLDNFWPKHWSETEGFAINHFLFCRWAHLALTSTRLASLTSSIGAVYGSEIWSHLLWYRHNQEVSEREERTRVYDETIEYEKLIVVVELGEHKKTTINASTTNSYTKKKEPKRHSSQLAWHVRFATR